MELLGIGPSELIFIFIIAIIVLGPKDMQKAGRTIGRWLNQLVKSDGWKAFQQTSNDLRNLPQNLMRDANMDLQETEKDIRRAIDISNSRPAASLASSSPLSASRESTPPQQAENSIQPPAASAQAASNAQAAVPGGDASAEDGAGSMSTAGSVSDQDD